MIDIDRLLCSGCGACIDICPTDAIVLHTGKAHIEQNLCRECQACINACPQGAILLVEQVRLHENKTEKPYSAPIPETTITDRSSAAFSLLGAVIDAGLACNSSVKQNLPRETVGGRQRNGQGRRGGHGQRKGRHQNKGRR